MTPKCLFKRCNNSQFLFQLSSSNEEEDGEEEEERKQYLELNYYETLFVGSK